MIQEIGSAALPAGVEAYAQALVRVEALDIMAARWFALGSYTTHISILQRAGLSPAEAQAEAERLCARIVLKETR